MHRVGAGTIGRTGRTGRTSRTAGRRTGTRQRGTGPLASDRQAGVGVEEVDGAGVHRELNIQESITLNVGGGTDRGHEPPVRYDRPTRDPHALDTNRREARLLIGGPIGDSVGIEQDQVAHRADRQEA